MASYRRLPSGKWQATVRLPNGRRVTMTDPLKSVLREWAATTESEARRGVWRDPRKSGVTVGEWHTRWSKGRMVEPETARGDDSSWRLHLAAHFDGRELDHVTRAEIAEWVRKRTDDGAGPAAVRRALNYLKTMLEAAVAEGLIEANPARQVAPPANPVKQPDWYTRREVEAITSALRDVGRESDAVMTEMMCWVGLRWGEAAALRGTDVDWLRKRVSVDHVLTQHGKDKPYPKNSSSIREVPIPAWLVRKLSALMRGRERDARIFVTRRGARNLNGSNWRDVFAAALERANVSHGTPHTCRHTAASWLVQAGVPLYDVRRQLGHASMATTERYAHLAPEQHRAVTGAWERLDAPRTHAARRRRRSDL